VVGNSTLKHDCNTNAREIADLIGGSAQSFIQRIKDSHSTELDQERKRAIADTTLLQTEIDRAVDPSSLMGFQAGASQQSRKIEEGSLCLLMQGTSVDPRIRPQFTDACSNPLLKFHSATKYIESEVSGTHRQDILRYFVVHKEAVGQRAASARLRQLVADELTKRALAAGVTIGPVPLP